MCFAPAGQQAVLVKCRTTAGAVRVIATQRQRAAVINLEAPALAYVFVSMLAAAADAAPSTRQAGNQAAVGLAAHSVILRARAHRSASIQRQQCAGLDQMLGRLGACGQPIMVRAGIKYRNPYQIRHTYASALLTAGANPWYVAQQLGHEDVEMVFRTYGKFIHEDYQKPKAELRLA